MTKPIRIQLSRKKGFRLQEHSKVLNGLPAVSVARGKNRMWGNPFRVVKVHGHWSCQFPPCLNREGIKRTLIPFFTKREAAECAVFQFTIMFESAVWMLATRYDCEVDIQYQLKGKNLACWCPLDSPCHADVLLKIANNELGTV